MRYKLKILKTWNFTKKGEKIDDDERVLVRDVLTHEEFWGNIIGCNFYVGNEIDYKDVEVV